jgi:hypothetical protein
MQALIHHPDASLLAACGSRAAAKAAYKLDGFLGESRKAMGEILRAHRAATHARMAAHGGTILAVQDTTALNYASRKKMVGLGYNCERTRGLNVHTCMAFTPAGVALGILHQESFTRPTPAPKAARRKSKAYVPIEEKESNRWLTTMATSTAETPAGVRVVTVCDREGDMYELFAQASATGQYFLIRLVHNRRLDETSAKYVLDDLRSQPARGKIMVSVPRDTRRGLPARQARLAVRFKKYHLRRPPTLGPNKTLPASVAVTVLQITEVSPPPGVAPIEWILGTNEPVKTVRQAREKVGYYVTRWRIERFHYVLKNCCKVEELQSHSVERLLPLLLMKSLVAVMVMTLTYWSRVEPERSCAEVFTEEEWRVLYCCARRTRQAPSEPYSLQEAVQYLGWLGGGRRAPSDGPPGVKLLWQGLTKLNEILIFREFSA